MGNRNTHLWKYAKEDPFKGEKTMSAIVGRWVGNASVVCFLLTFLLAIVWPSEEPWRYLDVAIIGVLGVCVSGVLAFMALIARAISPARIQLHTVLITSLAVLVTGSLVGLLVSAP